MTPSKYDEYMARAEMAEWIPMHLLKADDELIPGRDDLEEEE